MVLSEQNKREILSLYNIQKDEIAIVSALSLNENYAIFLDDLYDIKNKKLIGYVWENFDNFRIFFNDSNEILQEHLQILKNELNSITLVENKVGLQILKKQFILSEQEKKGFIDWAKQKGQEAISGTTKVISRSIQGVKDAANKFSQGEWMDAVKIVGQGVLYLAKKLRDALYHPVGMVLDAILVASGIGKSAQFVIWAIVVALDIYELSSGQYPEGQNFYTKLLFTGVDMIGLVFAGVAAKAANGVVGNFVRAFGKNLQTMKIGLQKSPAMIKIIEQMKSALGKAPNLLSQASQWLATKSPKIHKWMSGILGSVSLFIKKIVDALTYLGQATIKTATTVVAAPTKIVAKTAQALGSSAKTASKIGAGTTGVGLAGGLSYKMDQPSQTTQDFASASFDDVQHDFSKGL